MIGLGNAGMKRTTQKLTKQLQEPPKHIGLCVTTLISREIFSNTKDAIKK